MKTQHQPHLADTRARGGFSLVEVMLSLFILGLTATAVLATVLTSRRLSETAIYENMAFTVGQSFLEQIKSMEFEDVQQAVADPTNRRLDTVRAGVELGNLSNILRQPLKVGEWNPPLNERPLQVLIDLQRKSGSAANNSIDPVTGLPEVRDQPVYMPMRIRPRLRSMRNDAGAALNAIEVIVDYVYTAPLTGDQLALPDSENVRWASVRSIKSYFPTF